MLSNDPSRFSSYEFELTHCGGQFIIHTYGAPSKDEDMKTALLTQAVKQILDTAEHLKCQTIVFSATCTGLFCCNV